MQSNLNLVLRFSLSRKQIDTHTLSQPTDTRLHTRAGHLTEAETATLKKGKRDLARVTGKENVKDNCLVKGKKRDKKKKKGKDKGNEKEKEKGNASERENVNKEKKGRRDRKVTRKERIGSQITIQEPYTLDGLCL